MLWKCGVPCYVICISSVHTYLDSTTQYIHTYYTLKMGELCIQWTGIWNDSQCTALQENRGIYKRALLRSLGIISYSVLPWLPNSSKVLVWWSQPLSRKRLTLHNLPKLVSSKAVLYFLSTASWYRLSRRNKLYGYSQCRQCWKARVFMFFLSLDRKH